MTSDKRQLDVAVGTSRHLRDKLSDIWWVFLVRGVIAAGLGIFALFWPKATLLLLIRLVGIYVLFDGVMGLVSAIGARKTSSYLPLGIIGTVIGAVLLLWPDITGRWLLIMLGFWALLQGIALLLAASWTQPYDPDRSMTIRMGIATAIAGLALIIWPATGVVAISWIIAILALLVGAVFIFLAMRLRRVERSIGSPDLRP